MGILTIMWMPPSSRITALKAERLRAERKAHDATDKGQTVAPLVRNRKFESISLQQGVRCEPVGHPLTGSRLTLDLGKVGPARDGVGVIGTPRPVGSSGRGILLGSRSRPTSF